MVEESGKREERPSSKEESALPFGNFFDGRRSAADGRAPPPKGLFTDINAARHSEEDEEDAEEKERAKFDETTLMGRIARNKYFEWITLGVICFNALYLGYDCDYNARWGKPEDLYASSLWGFMLWDNFFCLFFTGELLIRFFGYKRMLDSFRDMSFLFDLFLVGMMIVETWILAFIGTIDALKQVSILRLLRLTRLLRMGKIMRYLPELKLIVKGMVAAVRSVGCAAILLVLVLYVFSIIFTNEYHQGHKADDDEDILPAEELFGSMGKSMRHLLIMATILDDITACTNTIRSTGKMHMLMFFMACVLVSSFTLFNMLLGILCEVVEATQNNEQEKEAAKKLHVTMMRFFKDMDLDGNGEVSRNEFLSMYKNPAIMKTLSELEINQSEFEKYAELLFTPATEGDKPPSLNYSAAAAMIMRLRPGQMLNACDFTYFKKKVLKSNIEIMNQIQGLEDLLHECQGNDQDLHADKPSFTNKKASKADDYSNDDFGNQDPDDTNHFHHYHNQPRGPMTISRLARSRAPQVSVPPPLGSRWQAVSPRDEVQQASPRSPKGRNPAPAGDNVVNARLQDLVEKRREINNNVREEMYGSGQMHMMYYHGAGIPNNMIHNDIPVYNAPYPDPEDDDEDYEPPWSPNGFVVD